MADEQILEPTIKDDRYEATSFDYGAASNGQLCAVVTGEGTEAYIFGAAIPKKMENGNLAVTINDEEYHFDPLGNPISNNAKTSNFSLKMGSSIMSAISAGTVGSTNVAYERNIDDEGNVTYEEKTGDYNITIEDLNARDQFAVQILKSLLEKEDNPSTFGKDKITYYCEAAYTWASYMMKESSEARNVIKDAEDSGNTQPETVGYLESNTEKLLNNIVAAIEKNNTEVTVSGHDVNADRITVVEMDALTRAINSLKTDIKAALQDIAAAVRELQTNTPSQV